MCVLAGEPVAETVFGIGSVSVKSPHPFEL